MLPNKELTLKEFKQIINYNRFDFGGEAVICETDNAYSLYKIFTHMQEPKTMKKSKVKKIELLHEIQPDYCITPIRTISLSGKIIGYEMTTDPNLETYKLYQLTNEELRYFLTKTKEILEYFSSLGIIYGDINYRNILFNRDTGEIKFCDMDNISINGIPMDIVPYTLQPYFHERGLDNGVHPYMHNIMTLKALNMDSYWATKAELRQNFKRPVIKIVSSMINPRDFNKEYIIQHIKKLTR